MYNEFIRVQLLNNQLLDILLKTALEIIKYADKHNIEIPYHIYNLTKDAQDILNQIDNPVLINKKCYLCQKINPANADYCCYCGSSLNITKVSPDLLQSKDNDSNHPKSDRTLIRKQ